MGFRATVGGHVVTPEDVLYPERAIGGYTRRDGTVDFYSRVSALVDENSIVLDFGAGRGFYLDEAPNYRQRLQNLRGRARRVIGVDIDPVVETNPGLDEAHVWKPGDPLPLADASIDVIVSDWTFEHIADPAVAAKELARVLKPGGWICARTPNRVGYIAMATRMVPNKLHARALRRLQPDRREVDVFPTVYAMNSPRQLARYFPPAQFEILAYTHNPEPAYFGRSMVAWRTVHTVSRLLPERVGATWHFFINKRG
jgi:SAM-dependent methyltransferase